MTCAKTEFREEEIAKELDNIPFGGFCFTVKGKGIQDQREETSEMDRKYERVVV